MAAKYLSPPHNLSNLQAKGLFSLLYCQNRIFQKYKACRKIQPDLYFYIYPVQFYGMLYF